MADNKKHEVITFKADQALWRALQAVPNRSEFIRSALTAALRGVCPLCNGTGSLTPEQQRHWESFAEHHIVEECEDCHATHLICVAGEAPCVDHPSS